MGILDLVSLAGTVAFALPIALLGASFVVDGRPLGWAFLAIAGLMVGLQQWLTTPTDLPGAVAQRAVSAVVKRPDDDED